MHVRWWFVVTLAAVALLLPNPCLAHGGSAAWVHVPAESIRAGQPFEVWGVDLPANSTVNVRMTAGERTASIGRVTAGSDGHFSTTLELPGDFPEGYAQLFATAADGSEASTWVLVAEPGGPIDAAQNQAASWSDPSVMVISVLVVGTLAAVALLLLRGRNAAPQLARAKSRRPASRKW